jgi:hypothetical protein
MLDDRPDMRDAVPATHPVVNWLIASFNGERIGRRVYWNASSPQSGRDAENGPAYMAYPPYIAISGGPDTSAGDKWAFAVFEMYNIENSGKFNALTAKAMAGSLDAGSFASKCVELEFEALEKTRDFFRQHPLPTSEQRQDEWLKWVTTNLGTFAEYKTAFDVADVASYDDNFKYYKDYYNMSLMPYVRSMRR